MNPHRTNLLDCMFVAAVVVFFVIGFVLPLIVIAKTAIQPSFSDNFTRNAFWICAVFWFICLLMFLRRTNNQP